MPSGSFQSKFVKCPFYKRDDGGHTITCEGVGNASSLTLAFKKKDDWRFQIKNYCEKLDGCEWCEIYHMIMREKY